MTRPAPIIAAILAALLLLFGAYMGAYYTVLEDRAIVRPHFTATHYIPVYRFAPNVADDFFAPAHRVDRWIRPRRWYTEVDAT